MMIAEKLRPAAVSLSSALGHTNTNSPVREQPTKPPHQPLSAVGDSTPPYTPAGPGLPQVMIGDRSFSVDVGDESMWRDVRPRTHVVQRDAVSSLMTALGMTTMVFALSSILGILSCTAPSSLPFRNLPSYVCLAGHELGTRRALEEFLLPSTPLRQIRHAEFSVLFRADNQTVAFLNQKRPLTTIFLDVRDDDDIQEIAQQEVCLLPLVEHATPDSASRCIKSVADGISELFAVPVSATFH